MKSTQNSTFNSNDLHVNNNNPNEFYRVFDTSNQNVNINAIKSMPNYDVGNANIRKNSGNNNGISAGDESSEDSDHEWFVKKENIDKSFKIENFRITIIANKLNLEFNSDIYIFNLFL